MRVCVGAQVQVHAPWVRGWVCVCGVVVVAERAGVNNWSHARFWIPTYTRSRLRLLANMFCGSTVIRLPSRYLAHAHPAARTHGRVCGCKRRREREREQEKEREQRESRKRVQQMQIHSRGRRGGRNERAEKITTVVSVFFSSFFAFNSILMT